MAIVGGVVMQRAEGVNFFFPGLLICFYQLASALLMKQIVSAVQFAN